MVGAKGGCDDFLNGENGTVMVQWSLFLILINGITEFVFALNQMATYWVFIAHPGLALIDVHEEEISQSLR